MLYQFDTDNLDRARAALLLYAMYRSRKDTSPLNGVETWERFNSFVRGACLKSRNTAEFVQNFCHKAQVGSILPRHLSTGDPVLDPETGELIASPDVMDYRVNVIEDDTLLPLFANETLYLLMLVRDRIQREKMRLTTVANQEDEL